MKGQMLHPNIYSALPCSGDHRRHKWMETWSFPSTAEHLVGMTTCMKLTPRGGGGVMSPPHLPGLLRTFRACSGLPGPARTFWACVGPEAQTPRFAQHTVCAMWTPSTHMSSCPITLLLTMARSSKMTRHVHVKCSPSTGFRRSGGVGSASPSHMGRAAADRLGSKIL